MSAIDRYVQKAVDNGWSPPSRVMEKVLNSDVRIVMIDKANLVELKSIGIILEDRVVVTNEGGEEVEERKTTTFHTSIFNTFLARCVFGDRYEAKILEMLDNQGSGLEAWLNSQL